jgi:hypothetical protein
MRLNRGIQSMSYALLEGRLYPLNFVKLQDIQGLNDLWRSMNNQQYAWLCRVARTVKGKDYWALGRGDIHEPTTEESAALADIRGVLNDMEVVCERISGNLELIYAEKERGDLEAPALVSRFMSDDSGDRRKIAECIVNDFLRFDSSGTDTFVEWSRENKKTLMLTVDSLTPASKRDKRCTCGARTDRCLRCYQLGEFCGSCNRILEHTCGIPPVPAGYKYN